MEEIKKKTPIFNYEREEFETDVQGNIKTVSGTEALQQIVFKAQQTARGMYLIYSDPENANLNHKYGTDAFELLTQNSLSREVRLSELRRVIKEAIQYDPWVTEVSSINVYDKGTEVYADYTIKTLFDSNITEEGVLISG